MYSASSRFNSILMYTFTIMAIMCGINYIHGRYIYDPKPDINFAITSVPSFMQTSNWEQLSFRFDL